MRLTGATILLFVVGICAGATSFRVAAQEADFHAIVERDGTVVLCLSKGQILFADRCAGTGRLTIVQPMQEGALIWRTARGTIVLENASPQNPDCALSRAKWDPKGERAVSSGKNIQRIDPLWVLAQLDRKTLRFDLLEEGDFEAFALDLDNDGQDEIIFNASNLERVVKLNEKTDGAYPYVLIGGILPRSSSYPRIFCYQEGTYIGGTDTIGNVVFKGVVPIAAETGEIALLVETGVESAGLQDLLRYRGVVLQRIETIRRRCD